MERLETEFTLDPAQDESIDDLNDDTFGDSEALTDDWEYQQQESIQLQQERGQLPAFFSDGNKGKGDLPDFFKEGGDEDLLEDALEPEGAETFEAEETFQPLDSDEFPTAKPRFGNDNEEFFVMDEQMNNSVMHFIDEDEDKYAQPKPMMAPRNDIWASPSRPPGLKQEVPKMQQPDPNNPLTKFLGALPKQQSQPQPYAPPGMPVNRVKGVLSVEELEARMRTTQIAPQPQQHPQQHPQQMMHPGMMHPGYGQPMPQMPPNQQMHQYPGNYPVHQMPQQPPVQYQQPPQPAPAPPVKPQVAPQVAEPEPQESESDSIIFSTEQFPVLSRNPAKLHTTPLPIKQSPAKTQVASSPQNSPSRMSSSPARTPTGRPRWKESKSMMSAYEIETIIRMQEAQLLAGNNPFAEDFYFVMRKHKSTDENGPFILHKPLFESNAKATPQRKPGADPLEGVLGRIPSHSVRAPRMLLQLTKSAEQHTPGPAENGEHTPSSTSSKVVQSLLLTIENAFQCVLDIEDLDQILKNVESASHFNVSQLRLKREEFTQELFKSLHVHAIPFGTLPQRGAERESDSYIFPEDELLMSLAFVHKGRKLLVRALPILFQDHVLSIFFVFLRNFAALVSSPRIELDVESTNKLFALLFNIVSVGSVTQTILSLQTILAAHADPYLIKILQSKFGLPIVQAILKRAYGLNLSPFSRRDPIPPEVQNSQLGSAGYHWKEAVDTFVQRFIGKFNYLFLSELGQTDRIWEFFVVLVVNINYQERRLLLTELAEKIRTTPMNQTLSGFLQIASSDQRL